MLVTIFQKSIIQDPIDTASLPSVSLNQQLEASAGGGVSRVKEKRNIFERMNRFLFMDTPSDRAAAAKPDRLTTICKKNYKDTKM